MIDWEQFSGPYVWKSRDRRFVIADYGDSRIVAWQLIDIHHPRKVGEFDSCASAKAACELKLQEAA